MGTWGMFPLNIMSMVRDLCLPKPSRKYRKEWISPSPTTQELLNKLDWQHWVGTMAMWDCEGQVQKCNLGVVLGLQCPNSDWKSQGGFSVLLMCFSFLHPQIREQNLQDIKTAGPQSQVLCGVVMDRSLVQVRAQNV